MAKIEKMLPINWGKVRYSRGKHNFVQIVSNKQKREDAQNDFFQSMIALRKEVQLNINNEKIPATWQA
jgi:hypothetical protein